MSSSSNIYHVRRVNIYDESSYVRNITVKCVMNDRPSLEPMCGCLEYNLKKILQSIEVKDLNECMHEVRRIMNVQEVVQKGNKKSVSGWFRVM